jgi:hypothetical protein
MPKPEASASLPLPRPKRVISYARIVMPSASNSSIQPRQCREKHANRETRESRERKFHYHDVEEKSKSFFVEISAHPA